MVGGHSREMLLCWGHHIKNKLDPPFPSGKGLGTNNFWAPLPPWFEQPCWELYICCWIYSCRIGIKKIHWMIRDCGWFPSPVSKRGRLLHWLGSYLCGAGSRCSKMKRKSRDGETHLHPWHLDVLCQIVLCFGGCPMHRRDLVAPQSLLEKYRCMCLRTENWRGKGASPGDGVVMRTILGAEEKKENFLSHCYRFLNRFLRSY